MAMVALASAQLPHHPNLCEYLSNTHFNKTRIYAPIRKVASITLPRMSISSAPNPVERNNLLRLYECLLYRYSLLISPICDGSSHSLAVVAPLKAILFDIDGTLCDSDPLHYYAFREMLSEVGFNGGIPIDDEFFIQNISGKHNEELCGTLLPDWDIQRARKFFEDKEDMFRRLASEQLEPVKGLQNLCKWIDEHGLRRAAVTNAPRPNGELIISILDLSNFFEILVIGNECERAKPFPDPYLTALKALEISHKHAFVFEDSVSGVKAGVAAGMPVVGLGTRNPEKLLLDAGASIVIKDFDDPKLWTSLEDLLEIKA